MSGGGSRRLGCFACLLWTVGCAIPDEALEPTREQAVAVFSEFMLGPEVTCEQLREEFQLQYLPLATSPSDIGLSYVEDWLVTEDLVVLRVWRIESRLDRGVVLLSMGAAGEIPCYLFLGHMLSNLGWSVVMFDYRGFGLSSGTPSVDKLAVDLERALDWTLAESGYEQVTLMGISLGSIPSVAVAVKRPEAVNGVILDSPVALGETLARFTRILPDIANALVELLTPELLSERIIDRMTRPLLVLQGDADWITTPETVQVLYERAGGPKRIAYFPGIGHARAPYRHAADYAAQVERFLAELWGQSSELRLLIEP